VTFSLLQSQAEADDDCDGAFPKPSRDILRKIRRIAPFDGAAEA